MIVMVILLSLTVMAQLKVGFIYIGPTGDAGWSYAHDQGRKHIEEVFGDKIETTYIESVPESMEALKPIESLVKRGYDLVITTSFGYMDPTLIAAQQNPDTWFAHCSGYKQAENMSSYFGRMYQPRFLSGIVAGMMTKSNKIGFVGAHPFPEVIRGINAFALGVNMVNPDANVHVVWSNTWYDPATEKEAALSLLDLGCDVIAQHQDSPAVQQAAQDRGVYGIAYNAPMKEFAPDAYLTAPVWKWGIYYEDIVRELLNDNHESEAYWGGMKDRIVALAPMTDLVPEKVKQLVKVFENEIVEGNFDPFQGPVYDQKGTLRIEEGEKLTDEELLSMSWFVSNVKGNIPSE